MSKLYMSANVQTRNEPSYPTQASPRTIKQINLKRSKDLINTSLRNSQPNNNDDLGSIISREKQSFRNVPLQLKSLHVSSSKQQYFISNQASSTKFKDYVEQLARNATPNERAPRKQIKQTYILFEENTSLLPQIESYASSRQPSRQKPLLLPYQRKSEDRRKAENTQKVDNYKQSVNLKLVELLKNIETINVTNGDQRPIFEQLNITPRYNVPSARNNTLVKTKQLLQEADHRIFEFRKNSRASAIQNPVLSSFETQKKANEPIGQWSSSRDPGVQLSPFSVIKSQGFTAGQILQQQTERATLETTNEPLFNFVHKPQKKSLQSNRFQPVLGRGYNEQLTSPLIISAVESPHDKITASASPIPARIREEVVPNPIKTKGALFRYQVQPGNNSSLIKRVIQHTRGTYWSEVTPEMERSISIVEQFQDRDQKSQINFRWSPTLKNLNLNSSIWNNCMINHLEGHANITEKHLLLKTLSDWYSKRNLQVFEEMTPFTFCLKIEVTKCGLMDQRSLHKELKLFDQVFGQLKTTSKTENGLTIVKIEEGSYNQNQGKPRIQQIVIPKSHYEGKNVWILKPVNLNRGRGIHLVSSVEEVKQKIVAEMCQEQPQISNHNVVKVSQSTEDIFSSFKKNKVQIARRQVKNTNGGKKYFILQKYIESPFLIQNKKIDIRVWVAQVQTGEVYFFQQSISVLTFFREGYIRLASNDYSLQGTQDEFAHLTNNAVQRYAPNYGSLTRGNQLGFNQLQECIFQSNPDIDFQIQIIEQMKRQVAITMEAAKSRLNPKDRPNCFELFGFDFMLDSDLKCWLIEVNTNPCLEESSPLLGKLLPRMIDDLLKITMDKVFAPLPVFQKLQSDKGLSPFQVEGHSSNINMWQDTCFIDKFQGKSQQQRVKSGPCEKLYRLGLGVNF